jgi:heme exporter protein A
MPTETPAETPTETPAETPADPSARPLLSARGLACARGGFTVLAGLSFDLPAGAALVVTGPNGSGKTTLLRTLAGLQPPAAGSLRVPAEGVAYAAHADALKPGLTAAANLAFWAALYGTGGDVAAALAAMDLSALAGRAAGHLSAGQKRRLGLARLLVSGRAVWVMDEPTAALDTASAARVAAMVAGHRARGGAVIAATHLPLGLDGAAALDLAPFRAGPGTVALPGRDEAFAWAP